MALNAVNGLPQILSQPLNRDDQSQQQRRVYEKPQAQKEDFEQASQKNAQAMNTIQANAQAATERPQAVQENKAAANEQTTYTETTVTTGSSAKGALIDLLV